MAKKATLSVMKTLAVANAAAKKVAQAKKKQLTIMVSSTVFGAESDLDQIAAILRQQFGYKVVMSKEGSVYVPVGFTPEQACLKAVHDCDLFFGIIFPRYGSGITHKEFLEANKINKPRLFISHERIEYLRKLLQPKMYTKKGRRTKFSIPKTTVLDNIKVVDMYNDVNANWVQSFNQSSEVMLFLETQFADMQKRCEEIEAFKTRKV
jgi:hypothetical protein